MALVVFGSGGQIRTDDLWVMSPTSYQAAPPRIDFKFTTYMFIVQRWDRDYRFSEFCQEVIGGNLLLSKGATPVSGPQNTK